MLTVSERERWSERALARGLRWTTATLTTTKIEIENKQKNSTSTKQPLDALADLLLAPIPPELRGRIRRSVANTAKALDDLLIRLGGGGQKALE